MTAREGPKPFEVAAYALGRQIARGADKRRVRITRREVHLPDGRAAIEEYIEIEEPA